MSRAAHSAPSAAASQARPETYLQEFVELIEEQRLGSLTVAYAAAMALAAADDETARSAALAEIEDASAGFTQALEALRNTDTPEAGKLAATLRAEKIDLGGLDKAATRTRALLASFANDNVPNVADITTFNEFARGPFRQEIDHAAKTVKAELQRIAAQAQGDAAEAQSLIDKTLTEIEEISLNVRLISLNASVEAARAGAAGRGFGVIASEIQSLAVRAQTSVDSVRAQIKDLSGSK